MNIRGVAQMARVRASEVRDRRFESCLPDHRFLLPGENKEFEPVQAEILAIPGRN